jgi:hypothetical protein
MRKISNPNYVAFGPIETVVTFATDRGQLRTNDTGDFFFREFTNAKFTCASPDLERQLIDAGVRAGVPVGITRVSFNRAVIWKVRIVTPVTEMTVPAASNGHSKANGLPARVYAKPDPPAPVWDGLPLATPDATVINGSEPSHAGGGLLGRCLVEALDACKVAHAHASAIGLPTTFGPGEVERMAVSIFIERTRYGSVVDRKPNGRAGYQNGHATAGA